MYRHPPRLFVLPVHGIGIVVFRWKIGFGERFYRLAPLCRAVSGTTPMPLFRASIGSCAAGGTKESLRSHALAGCRAAGAGTLALCSCEIEFFYFLSHALNCDFNRLSSMSSGITAGMFLHASALWRAVE